MDETGQNVVDLLAWVQRKRPGRLLDDVDPLQAVIVSDRATGRIDGILWVRAGLDPEEEAAVVQGALDERFPDGY